MKDDAADDSKPSAKHLKAVEGDEAPRTLSPKHREELEGSALDEATIDGSGIWSESKSAPVADALKWAWRNGGGMLIPFFDYDSRAVVAVRVKPDRPRTRKRGGKVKAIKYEQAPGTGAIPYFGPATIREQRLHDVTRPIVWTEGEKKTLCLDGLGYAAIGLTGVHNFNDAERYRNGDGLQWSSALEKYASRFVAGRVHVLAFDSDAFDNDHVMLAARRLAGLLLATGAAQVRIARIPPDPKGERKGVGVDDFVVEHGGDALRRVIQSAQRIADGEEITPIAPADPLLKLASLAWLRGAKLDADLRLPPRFEIRRDMSLWMDPPPEKPDADQREIMRSAVIPVRLVDELDGEEQRIELAFFARGRWQRAAVDVKALRDARRALAELPPGVTIDSNNNSAVVLWLGEYMRHNETRLRVAQYVSQCGWQRVDDGACFLLDEPITNGAASSLVADDAGDRADMIAALRPRGDSGAHFEAIRAAFDADPIAAVAILGALAAPLLEPLGAPNFAINLHGDSSRGKTSMIKIAASIYGDPRSQQWLGSWNATGVAMELRAQTLSHLPLLFDEVGAGDGKPVDRWIYMLTNGVGKARGDRSLRVRRTPSWATVVISTGEHELVTENANTGAQVRVLQFRVRGFGNLDAAGVDALRGACEAHFGHVGRRWIESLVAIEDWAPYRELYDRALRAMRANESDPLMQRQAVYFALLAVAEHLASSALGMGQRGGKTARAVFEDTTRRREVTNAAYRAREVVSQWIASEPGAFPALEVNAANRLTTPPDPLSRRIAGVRYRGQVCLLPVELRARLGAHGISAAEVIAAWGEAGHLDTDPGRRTKKVRWDGRRVGCYVVSGEFLGIEADESAGEFDD